MVVNMEKSNLIHNDFSNDMIQRERETVPFHITPVEDGFKYLGFFLKPNNYSYQDWVWLYKKIKSRVTNWGNRFLSRGGRLVLLKFVEHSSVLRINSLHSQRHFDKNQKEMFLFFVDIKQEGRGNPLGKMDGHFSSKGIRRMVNNKSRIVLQSPSC